MREILALAVAGAAGTVSRFALVRLAGKFFGETLPFGTLAVNLLGSLVLGVLVGIALNTSAIPRAWMVPLTVGFFGAFTTFSTFSVETVHFMESGAWQSALVNVVLNLLLCLGGAWLGLAAGRAIAA